MARTAVERLRGAARERHAREALGRLEQSGLSKAAFCRREQISTVTLGRWRREFGSSARSEPQTGFVEVRLDRPPPTEFVLEFPGGRRLRIPAGFDATELERVLSAVARGTC